MNTLIKILLTFCLLVIVFLRGVAQENLVPNPSFEEMVNCPTVFGDFSVSDWNSPTQGSPDYLNSCNNGDANVLNNVGGNQSPFSGNGYVGIGVYDTNSIWSYREYIQGQLQQVLASGQKYWVNFYVSLGDTSMYAIQEIGAYFSEYPVNDNSMDSTLVLTPQVEFADSVIIDKNGWTKISGSFIANGNEHYLIIGNFNRSQNTTALQVSNNNNDPLAYYYIDNICISTDSSFCANYVYSGIEEEVKNNFNIYPNPVTDYFEINQTVTKSFNLIIYNPLGQKLYEEKDITTKNKIINTSQFPEGILFINIESNNQSINYKLLKL